jgi:sortase A
VKRWINIILVYVMIVGVCVLVYGGYSHFSTKSKGVETLVQAQEILEQREDIPEEVSVIDVKDEFKKLAQIGDVIGQLTIPKLDGVLPIVEGVNEDELSKGVGHYQGTSFPLDNNQIVLSGHRDTVFRGMGDLEIGDTMTVSLPYGDFEYEIYEMYVTGADDLSVIVPHDEEVLTVTTCYPFNFIGNAPDRYIINAKPLFDVDGIAMK